MPEPEPIDDALHAQLRLFCALMLGSPEAADRVINQIYQENSPPERMHLFRLAAARCGLRP